MKRICFALAIVALLLPAAPRAGAAEVSIDFFYNNLGSEGNWVDVDDYGYCFQPNVAVSNSNWRPYSDGYWAYTDVGWTWVSYESFGWATYHYGRWANVRDQGWLWVPGREWGPAWVSWRTGGDQVGWAPLPPRRNRGGGEVVYEGRSIGGQVDIDFDIGPSYYNFVDVRYIGAPVLREHIYAPSQNVNYINNTVNVTNISYNNSVVYNYGPDYDRLNSYSNRPIQRLRLERQTNADLNAAAQAGSLTKVQGGALLVAAPAQFQKTEQPIAPRNVKRKIAKPDLETGWMGITDPNAKAQLQAKMKKEDPKVVPPPQAPVQDRPALTAASPAAGTPPTPAPSPAAPAIGSAPAPAAASPAAASPAAASPAPTAIADQEKRRGRDKRERGNQPPATDAAAADASPAAPDDQRRGRGRNARPPKEAQQPPADAQSAPPTPAPVATPDATAAPQETKRPGRRELRQLPPTPGAPGPDQPVTSNAPAPAADQPARGDGDRGRGRGRKSEQSTEQPPPAPPSQLNVAPQENAQEQRRNRKEQRVVPPQAAPQVPSADAPAAPQRRGKAERPNKKKKGDEEASPAPEQ